MYRAVEDWGLIRKSVYLCKGYNTKTNENFEFFCLVIAIVILIFSKIMQYYYCFYYYIILNLLTVRKWFDTMLNENKILITKISYFY